MNSTDRPDLAASKIRTFSTAMEPIYPFDH